MAGSRLARLIREGGPVVVRHDLSGVYAQISLFDNGGHKGELWITAVTLELKVILSGTQIALLARDAVAAALAPVDNANLRECWKPRVADRSPAPLDAAYQRILEDLEAYRTPPAAN